MEIKSSLLNEKEFAALKETLIEMSEIDNKEKFRVRLIEYINDTADNNADMFFYDMLEFTRFINPNSKHIAYTDEDKLIYLNAPGIVGEKVRQWDFIYCHECLHQLWDTFGVADKIKENGITYNHNMLNIASDCVINDYLAAIRKKEEYENGITPQYLKEKFGIEYNRKVDTQFTLYLKLLEKKDELEDDERIKQNLEDGDTPPPEGNDEGGEGEGGGKEGDKKNRSKDKGDDDSNQDGEGGAGNGDGEEQQDGKGQGNSSSDEQGDGKGEANEKGKGKQGKESDKGGSESESGEGEGEDSKEGGHKGHGKGATDPNIHDGEKTRKKAEAIIEKYRNKISGDFGDFIKKCKASVELKASGIGAKVQKGSTSWNESLKVQVNSFVKKKVFQKKRKYISTYSRVKRGSGVIKFGEPIEPGRKVREEKLNINVAFYIDRSGSMDACIKHVFDACYTIAEGLKRQFGKEDVVEDLTFKIFAFDDVMVEIPWGKRAQSRGGTMAFHKILEFMSKNTKEYMINIIITDADFVINVSEIKNFIKGIDGMVSFITNTDNAEVKELAKQKEFADKLYYILADKAFSVK